jgi:hypothetical protein
MFPYLDLSYFRARTIIDGDAVDMLESRYPGWIAGRVSAWSSWLNAQARKLYGANYRGTSLPFGQVPPVLLASGTSPPGVTLTGRPALGSLQVVLKITTGGAVGAALFEWSVDGGATWVATGVATAAAVVLGSTGLTAVFSPGTYGTDNLFAAATPVAEVILGWLVSLLNLDVMRKRGVNPQDPMVELMVSEVENVRKEVQEAANGKDGLWELPVSEDGGGARTTGGPMFYSEASPYVSADLQEREGHCEDLRGRGTYGGRGD